MTPTREQLLYLLPIEIEAGFYIDSDDGQPNPLHVYCIKHARAVAERWGRARGIDTYICGAWAGSDHLERCAIKACDIALDCGTLTDYGVDSALGLTETDPHACYVSPEELAFAANAMMPDDPRWALWDYHLLATTAYLAQERAA